MRRRSLLLLVPLLVAAGFALAGRGPAPADLPPGPPPTKAARPNKRIGDAGAVRVVDGDTLRIGEVRIRLHGIDAPEQAQSGAARAAGRLAGELRAAGRVSGGAARAAGVGDGRLPGLRASSGELVQLDGAGEHQAGPTLLRPAHMAGEAGPPRDRDGHDEAGL